MYSLLATQPTLFLLFLLTLVACSDGTSTVDSSAETMDTEVADAGPELPADLVSVLSAHGGLDAWREQEQLSYTIARDGQEEKQMVALRDRREWIKNESMEMGYDGEHTWVVADSSYQGDPLFYRNLMFYFYAMPWVLADPGINYDAAEPLVFGDASYPGIKISYDDGVGLSPKDNYYLHYDEGSGQMRWLGYTVTYRSGEVSDDVRWIEYPTWTQYNGVALPDSLVWYTVEEGQPTTPRNARRFVDVDLNADRPVASTFAPPAGATIVD